MRTLTRKKRPIYANERKPKNPYDRISLYLKDRIEELKYMADSTIPKHNNPWCINSALEFIDFLCSHCNDSKTTGTDFPDFINRWIYPNTNIVVTANNKNISLADILYVVARCGGVHNYSTSPYQNWNKSKAYKNTIFITNNTEKEPNEYHLEIVNVNLQDGNSPHQGIIIVAEDFIEDIESCVNKIISALKSRSKKYTQLKKNLKNSFYVTCPPYSWYGYK